MGVASSQPAWTQPLLSAIQDHVYATRTEQPSAPPMPEEASSSGSTVAVTTSNLNELLSMVNNATRPTVFDLGGQRVHGLGSQSVLMDARNMTLRNGTIILASSPTEKGSSLCVRGTNVQLEDIVIISGHVGLWVRPGATVTLLDCEIQGSHIGVWVGSTDIAAVSVQTQAEDSELTAFNLKVSGCGKGSGFTVGRGGSATLTDCSFTGGGGHGMLVFGDGPTRLTAKRCVSSGNGGKGMVVLAGAEASMTRCLVTGNKEASMIVRGVGSKVSLNECTVDPGPVSCECGVVEWVRR